MNRKLKEKILESLYAVVPISVIVLLISVFITPMELGTISMFLVGAVLLIVGMGFFQLGAEISMTPLGEGIGVQLSKTKKLWIIILISVVMGVLITIAEPDLQVLAGQVLSIPNAVLIWAVAAGVGLFLALAILRILFRVRLSTLLFISYLMLFGLSIFVPSAFLAVGFDAGGVTTGPITVPFIMAMGVGLAALRSDKNASDDSFGLVALSSIGPIFAVLLLGIFYNPGETAYTPVVIADVATTQDVVREFVRGLPHYAREVLVAMLPLIGVFFLFNLFTRRFRRRQVRQMITGFAYTYLGLVLFLTGVNVGFCPVGNILGSQLAESAWRWLLIPLGMLIGYFIVKAEPAVQVLNRQVQEVTGGAISQTAMNRCLSIGVSVSVGLSMLRVLTGLPIYWIIIPGYAIALLMSRRVPSIFVGIAFDSGGVSSGPMTSTFLLPLSMGACEALGGNVMTDAFGVVALVAMTPLIAVQIMGLVYNHKLKSGTDTPPMSMEGDESIVEYGEELSL